MALIHAAREIKAIILILLALLVGSSVTAQNVPRAEHPKPQFYRDNWLNLNGEWNFSFDFGMSGLQRGWPQDPSSFGEKIIVPFCPESRLSGLQHTDFIPGVWYHRTFQVPQGWIKSRIFIHFGAVDYDCRVWINGELVGRHYGGSASFTFEITDKLKRGTNDVVVFAADDLRSGAQPRGKQSPWATSRGVVYTRVTGIWQTVWIEARPESYIESVRIVPNLDEGTFVLVPIVFSNKRDLSFKATLLSADGEELVSIESNAATGIPRTIKVNDPHPWTPADPYLYDFRFELLDQGKPLDVVKSYAGLRKFHIEGNKFYLNNEPIFLRFVLDQGYYPTGIWTAPSDEALRKDIELSMAVGFNGARLHQKVFEERFHYWADKLGYLTWGEFPDWGISLEEPEAPYNIQREWCDVVARDSNQPSIIAWTPFNETRRAAEARFAGHRRLISETVTLTRMLDPSRPINDASGYVHVLTDIFTVHDYDQNPQSFKERYANVAPGAGEEVFIRFQELSSPYLGQPYVVDEYGGTFWTKEYTFKPPAGESRNKWGFGKTSDQVVDLIEKLTKVLTDHPNIAGFTYTQLTDVEQEVNGIYTYRRKLKFDGERLRKIFGAPAAIEKENKK
jgi:beta-galactosidase/beta-glucuronidase